MSIKLRDYKISDLIEEFYATRKREGQTEFCPVFDWLKKHKNEHIDEFENWVIKSDYGPFICKAFILTAGFAEKNTPAIAEEIQCLYANYLVKYPWTNVRGIVEDIFRAEDRFKTYIYPSAIKILIKFMRKNHPDPKAFFDRPHIIKNVPVEIDLSDLPTRDRSGLAGKLLCGAQSRPPA